MKTIWKNIACRIWLIITPIVLALIIAINVVGSVTFFDAISTVLGRETTRLVGEEVKRYSLDEGIESKADALANGNSVSKEICEEGSVLLKNNDGALPLKNGANVSVFGKSSVNLAVGGSGSGGGIVADFDLFDSLTQAGFSYNKALVDFYKDNSKSGNGRSGNPTDMDSGNEVSLEIGETPLSSYNDSLWNSCSSYNDAALIVLTRIGGEGFDLPRSSDGTHSLQLSKEESDLINKVGSMNFKSVVVILNTVTSLELKDLNENDDVDAILWIGYTGGQGILALGEILKGDVNPSGRTVDTWAADFTHSPVWANFGAALDGDAYKFKTVDARTGRESWKNDTVYFVDYEEGIYVGYRYYETRYASYTGPISSIGEDNGLETADDWYSNEVVYPFGYGMSYTTFDWDLTNAEQLADFSWDSGDPFTVKVKVTNTGSVAGKEVVQLYVTAPDYVEKANDGKITGIEKSAKVLVGFAKTGLLQPGAFETVEITVDRPYDFASYDCYDANGNGFKGYECEKGIYTFTVGMDAHNAKFTVDTLLSNDLRYEKDPDTDADVVNLYTDCENERDNSDAELGSVLSRADWEGTWPVTRITEEKAKEISWIEQMKSGNSVTNRPEQDYQMPVTGARNSIMLDELIGVDYNDKLWDDFMDQLTLSEMTDLVNKGAFHTVAIQRLQVPQTTASDGPVGFVNFIGAPEIYDTCAYPSEVVIASTWNRDLVKKMGESVGNEALIGNEKGDGAPYSGWYAPGLNIHRSPFSGRNYEYYSEDSYFNGVMTAAIVEGCAEKGVFVAMKHFALNDQETHRSTNGLLTWATEQSMREIYLKSFEVAIKAVQKTSAEEGKIIPLALMSSFNRIGERWTGGDYRLLNNILRGEWDFRGFVMTDFNTCTHMNVKDMVYAGGDLNLEMAGLRTYTPDKNSAADVTAFREAAKNILYVVANGNAMRGEFVMVRPLWQTLLFVADAVVIAGLAAWGTAVIVLAFKKQKKVVEETTAEPVQDAQVNSEE